MSLNHLGRPFCWRATSVLAQKDGSKHHILIKTLCTVLGDILVPPRKKKKKRILMALLPCADKKMLVSVLVLANAKSPEWSLEERQQKDSDFYWQSVPWLRKEPCKIALLFTTTLVRKPLYTSFQSLQM